MSIIRFILLGKKTNKQTNTEAHKDPMSCCWQKAELELEPKSVTMPAIFCFSVLVLPSVPL